MGLAVIKKKRVSSIASLLFKAPAWFPLAEVYKELVTGEGQRAVNQFAQQLSALHALLDTCRSPVLQRRLHPTTLLQLRSALKWLSLGMGMIKVRSPLALHVWCDALTTPTVRHGSHSVGLEECVSVCVRETSRNYPPQCGEFPVGVWVCVCGTCVELMCGVMPHDLIIALTLHANP